MKKVPITADLIQGAISLNRSPHWIEPWRLPCGDNALRYVDGLRIFGLDLAADYLPDQLHPNADAQEIIARNVVAHVLT